MNIETRTAQVIKASKIDRNAIEEADESDPIIYTETAPNRFNVLTYFFPEEDGVRIEEDLDLHEITIHYFNDEGDTELTEGALYDWALNLYKEDNR